MERKRHEDMAPHQRTRLLQDFLIPHLNMGTFREKLHWVNPEEGTFKILWKHQSSSRFRSEDSVVYMEWAKAKRLWDPSDKRSPTIAKQRLRAALLKLRNVRCTRRENEYRIYKIEPTLDLNVTDHHAHYPIIHSNQSFHISAGNHSDSYSTDESNHSYEINIGNHPDSYVNYYRNAVPNTTEEQFTDVNEEYLESDNFIEQVLNANLFNYFPQT
ncbi:IRF tryptophan pentad repeat domain-containing protein [Nephila pilipes]|uniref:IRF tryptophan pentad repeat domain-containing protein n=1 Tax=Nephila pilipes TaxID=299642 RepID=A0A8X6UX46_NEPPI|nr:IRF tryptophan pentad repeat domain-containing protein [Nephila pilipes]